MICPNCGQATAKGTSWGMSFIPCSCPVDKEAEEKRYEQLRKKLNEAKVRINGG